MHRAGRVVALSVARTVLWLVIGSSLMALVSGCSRVPEQGERVIATTRDGVVTARQLDVWLSARRIAEPPADPRPEIEQLVLTRVLAASAVADGLDRQPAIAFQLRLIEDRTLATALARHTAEAVTIPEEEIDEILAANPDAFSKPLRVRLYNVFKRFPPGASDADRARIRRRMEEIRDSLRAGGDIAAIALAESDSDTRYRGGRMGTFEQGELPPALDAIVMNLADGEVSEILATGDGLTVFQCRGVFPAESPSLEESRANIGTNLLRMRRREAHQRTQEELLAESGLEIDMPRALDPSTPDDDVVARFGPHNLTRWQLEMLVAARRPAGRSAPLDEGVVRESVEAHVVTTLAAERARALDLDDEERIATMRVQQQMALATQELRRRVGDRLVDPTQTEVEAYYAAHRDDFHHPGEVDLMLIGFSFTDETLLEIHDRARTALDAIDRGTLSFEEARHRYSELAAQGDAPVETLTNLELAGYGPAVGKAVNGLAPGEVSRLIRQDDRLWIVKLVGRRPPAPMSFEEAERTARHKLGQQRVDELAAAIERQVVEDAEITLAGDAG